MDFPVIIPFAEHLGMQLVRFERGLTEIRLAKRPELTNSFGVMHGGVTMTLLDIVMAHAARSGDLPDGDMSYGVVTIEMKTSFMRPASGDLRAVARLIHRTASMAFCEASVLDDDDQVLSQATGTFKFVKRRSADSTKIDLTKGSD